jgi:hypothetical protein
MRRSIASLAVAVAALAQWTVAAPARSEPPQVVNASRRPATQAEAAVAVNPLDPDDVVISSVTFGRPGLWLGVSHDGGTTFTSRFIAVGNRLPVACCDPTMSWDENGNLFLAYLDHFDFGALPVAISTDGGDHWDLLAVLHPPRPGDVTGGPASGVRGSSLREGHGGVFVDQPTVTSGPRSVWLVWNSNGRMQAAGARTFGLGDVARFRPVQNVPGSRGCSFGDVSVGPEGEVMQVCTRDVPAGGEFPTSATIRLNLDPDGLGPLGFEPTAVLGPVGVAQFDAIRPQEDRTIDAETGLAWDRTEGPHHGRVYLVYTDEKPDESDDTDVWVRFSDDDGATWSDPVKVNDDGGLRRSQFLPRIAIDRTSGTIAVGFHDARLDAGDGGIGDTDGRRNSDAMYSLAFSVDGGESFGPNVMVATGPSNSLVPRSFFDYGDYTGLAFEAGVAHPAWADNSNSTGDNPDGALRTFDIYTAAVPVL